LKKGPSGTKKGDFKPEVGVKTLYKMKRFCQTSVALCSKQNGKINLSEIKPLF